jgi:hypothetical protein
MKKISLTVFNFLNMKKINSYLVIIIMVIVAASCKKSDPVITPSPTVDNFMTYKVGSVWHYKIIDNNTLGSIPDTFSLTASGKDTTALSGKVYTIFNRTDTAGTTYNYFNLTDHNYYQIGSLASGLGTKESLYLNDTASVGYTWNDQVSIPLRQKVQGQGVLNFGSVDLTVKNTIQEKGSQLITLNGNHYSNFIKVKSEIISYTTNSSDPANYTLNATLNNQSFSSTYASKYGLIEKNVLLNLATRVNITGNNTPVNLRINTNTTTILNKAELK